MENNNIVQIENNTYFISNGFYEKGIEYSDNWTIDIGKIDYLRQSIKIIESGDFSKRVLKRCLLEVSAPMFWNDLFYLNTYKRAVNDIEKSIKTAQTKFQDYPDNDDVLTIHDFNSFIERRQQNLKYINTIIDLTNKFQTIILQVLPNLETEFSNMLDEHNKLQTKEAAIIKERTTRKEIKKQNIKQAPPPTTDYGALQFDNDTLEKIFVAFKNLNIWEPIKMNDFTDNFREMPKLSLKIIDKPMFSYIFHHFKNSFIYEGNKNAWIKERFNIANFGNHNDLSYTNRSKAIKLEEINQLLGKMNIRKTE